MDDFEKNNGKQQEHLAGKSSGESNNRIDFPRKTNQEEYAAEIYPTQRVEDQRQVYSDRDSDNVDTDSIDAGKTTGYVGVGIGIASLFMWSLVLGPVAAVLGLVAFNQGRKTSGGWAIGLGALSVLSYFLLPMGR